MNRLAVANRIVYLLPIVVVVGGVCAGLRPSITTITCAVVNVLFALVWLRSSLSLERTVGRAEAREEYLETLKKWERQDRYARERSYQ